MAGFAKGMALGFALVGGLVSSAAASDADKVVATVNGVTITQGHIAVQREQLPAQYQQLPDDVLVKGILEQIIQQTVLSQSVGETLTRRDEIALENDRRTYLASSALQGVVAGAVTDAALEEAYNARFKDADPKTEYNAAHILVETEDEAKGLKTDIDGGADFAELAKQHSKDGAAASGGSLGWFGPGMMVKP
ncbi:MAG: peptidylprolyl isomerase, partial [Gemmobacter sp.]|nr:peptidylprolyl isomerase [Gemmobacter sp.]